MGCTVQYQASLFDVIAPRYRASAVAMMTMVAFLIGSTSPWLLGSCCTLFANGNGLSYGFAALSAGLFYWWVGRAGRPEVHLPP